MRKSFVLHIDSLEVLNELTDEQAGKLFKAIKSFNTGDDIELDSITKIVMVPFKAQFVRDNEKYIKKVECNKINGLKGGRPKSSNNQNEKTKTEDNPLGYSGIRQNPEKGDSDSDSGSDSGSDSDIKRSVVQRFTPPTHQEALQYFQEKGFNNPVEASKFVDFYEMKGWMVGKNKMKDWKAAIRNWTKNMTPVAAQQHPKRPRAFGS